jgi:hypothetical protein
MSKGAVYDSAEEAEREFEEQLRASASRATPAIGFNGARAGQANGAAQPVRSRLRVIRKPSAPPAGPAPRAYQPPPPPAPAPHPDPAPEESVRPRAELARAERAGEGGPQKPAPQPQPQPRPSSMGLGFSTSASPQQAFPATLFWGDKLQALGAVYLVAEALVRGLLMSSEEFADRVAWVVLERMVQERGLADSFAAEAKAAAAGRSRALADIRRQLGEIRSTHASFHTVADSAIVHGAVLVLLRVAHLAALSAEFALAPYGYTLDRHVQEMVFLCDFAAMVLGKIKLGDRHEPMVESREGMPALWMPAHYANEAMVRGLAALDVLRAEASRSRGASASSSSSSAAGVTSSTVARNASRLLQENSQAMSNTWLSRNLLRLALGYKTLAGACGEKPLEEDAAALEDAAARPLGVTLVPACRASVHEILRERAVAIQAWTQRHGIDTSSVFMDPLYRVEAELQAEAAMSTITLPLQALPAGPTQPAE